MQLKLYVYVSALFFIIFIFFSINLLVPSFCDTGIPVSGINSFIPSIPNNRAPIHMKHQEFFLITIICCGTLQQLECCKHPEIKVARGESLACGIIPQSLLLI